MRIDIRKLDFTRSAVDDLITELALKASCKRLDALFALIRELGFEAEVLEHEGWYFASASTEAEKQLAHRIYYRRGLSGVVTYETRILSQRLCIAYTFEDAVLALLCRLVDPLVDLNLEIFEPADRIVCANRTNADDPLEEYIYYSWDDIDHELGPAGLKRELACTHGHQGH